MHVLDAAVLLTFLGAFLTITFLIAADRKRYLTRFDLAGFPDRQYLSRLPNFLHCFADAGFPAPWPRRLNAVSALRFRLRLRRILKAGPASNHAQFIHQHLALQALLTILAPFIDDAILTTQLNIAARHILTMADTEERDRLIRFVARARARHIAFHNSLTSYDRATLKQIRAHNFFSTLRSANAMFHEHGFTFLPALDSLRHWGSLEGSEIALDLPHLPKLTNARPSAHAALS